MRVEQGKLEIFASKVGKNKLPTEATVYYLKVADLDK